MRVLRASALAPNPAPPQHVLHRAARDPAGAGAEHDGGHDDHRDEEDEGDGILGRGSGGFQRGHTRAPIRNMVIDNHGPLSELLTSGAASSAVRHGFGITCLHFLQVRNSSLSKKRA